MESEQVVAAALAALKGRRPGVVIRDMSLRLLTQLLRISLRSLKLFIAKKLVGH